jgi:acyl dehydratase
MVPSGSAEAGRDEPSAQSGAEVGPTVSPKSGYFYEDLKPGAVIETIGRTILESDVAQFVQLTALFEETFINQEYVATDSAWGQPAAPGALVFTFAEGLAALAGAFGQGLAFLGLSELRIHKPTLVGDTIRTRIEVAHARPSSKPGRGVVSMTHAVTNHRDTTVMTYTSARLIRMRNAPDPKN